MALFCSQCGAENHPDAVTCYNCQSPMARPIYDAGHQSQAPSDRYTREAYQETAYGDGYTNANPNENPSAKGSPLSRIGSVVIGAVCAIYLLNPTFGAIELIPDVIPVIGNLDEATAMAGLLMALSNLGVIPYRRT